MAGSKEISRGVKGSGKNKGPIESRNQREETVLHGHHPEVASIHTMDYNNRDPYLEARPKRMDLEYVSPEERRLRHKGGTTGPATRETL